MDELGLVVKEKYADDAERSINYAGEKKRLMRWSNKKATVRSYVINLFEKFL
ncbi:hypothetical protein INT80_06740 [Gallibacterium anatis]|uniref:Uncharacterized protein n=1 Tax=Gallibacterium anatis TaxID=750 RepID=A0A930UUS5_9PAST|nr:hypothetical protein [Gallibacterium anatis]